MNAVVRPATARLRRLATADLDGLTAIEGRAYAHGWTRGIFEDCLRVGYGCWGVDLDGVLVGYGIVSLAAGESHLLNLAVDPASRRMGLGRLLLEHLFSVAREWRAECMYLEVRPSNLAARMLYASTGFDEFGRRHGYYPQADDGRREDALVLRKEL
jgi:[ribosomal protein S18]-alanine N-acetyltransferase